VLKTLAGMNILGLGSVSEESIQVGRLLVGCWAMETTNLSQGRTYQPTNEPTNQPTNKNIHINAKTRNKKNGPKIRAQQRCEKLQGYNLASIAIEHCWKLVLGFGITVTTSL